MIVSCIVSHNRLDLTKLTVESYLNTVDVPHYLVVVDNASTDGTREWLGTISEIDLLIQNFENRYPGAACNQGWEAGLEAMPDAKFLHRSDNDIFYWSNWDHYALEVFQAMPNLGQFGLMCLKDHHYPGRDPQLLHEENGQAVNRYYPNVGGIHVTRREIWDAGVRHIEKPWAHEMGEDQIFSMDVAAQGYFFGHTIHPIAMHLGTFKGNYKNRRYLEYYRRTYKQRLDEELYPDIPSTGVEF